MSNTEKLEQGIFIQNVTARRLFTLIKVVAYSHPFIHPCRRVQATPFRNFEETLASLYRTEDFQGILVEIMRSLAPQKLKKTLTFLKVR